MILCANKSDLESERQVTTSEGQQLAKSFGVAFFETSAKVRINVDECFFELIREIRKEIAPNPKKKKTSSGKFKAGHLKKHASLLRSPEKIIRGLLVTCNQKTEPMAISELSHLLNMIAEKFYIEEYKIYKEQKAQRDENKQRTVQSDQLLNTPQEQMEQSIEREQERSKYKLFTFVNTACSGVLFVEFHKQSMDPLALANLIFSNLDLVQTCKHIHRIPLQRVFMCTAENFATHLKSLVQNVFHTNDQQSLKYAVVYTSRNNSQLTKEHVIETSFNIIGAQHKVNLEQPDYVVLVDIFKDACGIGLLPNFYNLKKYNLRTLYTDYKSSSK